MAEDSGGLISVDRALRILELLGERRVVRVVEVAEHVGVSRSTAHRLLATLLRRGFVVQDAAKVYHQGPAFLAAGFGAQRIPALRAAVRPSLEVLAARTNETCHVVVLEGNGARFIDSVESTRLLRVGSRIGALLPAHTTAAGKALLAELTPADFFTLYPQGIPGAHAELTRRGALQRELAAAHALGYATNFDESERGVTALSVAVRDAGCRAVASLAVAAPSARCPQSRIEPIVAALRAAAAGASAALLAETHLDSARQTFPDPPPGIPVHRED